MKVYSDTLTREDLYASLPSDVYLDAQEIRRPRTRARGWTVYLEGLGDRHTRNTNSGNYGAGSHKAATWDDHGLWMAKLYEIDPMAKIAHYDSRSDFYDSTARYQPVGVKAPWLKNPVYA